ncbi:MAG TPA: AraC family transcriptional regulator [Jiangellaceae bacterium]
MTGWRRPAPTARNAVTAWRPAVDGVTEVFHARFIDHAYPSHTHDSWTLLIVDAGVIRYDLDRHEHGVVESTVTLLPPDVPHDGRPGTRSGFFKRVLYLDRGVLDNGLIDAAVDRPSLRDPVLRRRVGQLHQSLAHPADSLEAESRLEFITERLRRHLRPSLSAVEPPAEGLAAQLRDLLDARLVEGVTLAEAATLLHAHPTHLVRAFTRRYGLPPHRYVTGRRIEAARSLLLAGAPPAEVATRTGFYDQAHLSRHFQRYLGVSPSRYRRQ